MRACRVSRRPPKQNPSVLDLLSGLWITSTQPERFACLKSCGKMMSANSSDAETKASGGEL